MIGGGEGASAKCSPDLQAMYKCTAGVVGPGGGNCS